MVHTPPVYEVNDVDRDERGRIVHAEDSTLAEVLAQTVDLVPEERRADLMFFLIRLQHARSKAALAASESWLRTVQRAYSAGRLAASSEAMKLLTYRVLFSTVYGGFGSDSAGGSSTGSGGGSSVGVGGAGGVFGIGRGLFGSGGVGGTSISARIKSRPLCCARLSCSLIEHLQIHRIVSVAFDAPR